MNHAYLVLECLGDETYACPRTVASPSDLGAAEFVHRTYRPVEPLLTWLVYRIDPDDDLVPRAEEPGFRARKIETSLEIQSGSRVIEPE